MTAVLARRRPPRPVPSITSLAGRDVEVHAVGIFRGRLVGLCDGWFVVERATCGRLVFVPERAVTSVLAEDREAPSAALGEG